MESIEHMLKINANSLALNKYSNPPSSHCHQHYSERKCLGNFQHVQEPKVKYRQVEELKVERIFCGFHQTISPIILLIMKNETMKLESLKVTQSSRA